MESESNPYSALSYPLFTMRCNIKWISFESIIVTALWNICTREGGGSYFPYILLNEIQTMFSQPANFDTARTLKLNPGEQIPMFLPRTKSRTSAEVKEEASELRS